MIYSVVSIVSPSKSINPITGAIGYKIGLSFIPELIAVLALAFVGLATHTLRREVKSTIDGQVRAVNTSGHEASKLERGI